MVEPRSFLPGILDANLIDWGSRREISSFFYNEIRINLVEFIASNHGVFAIVTLEGEATISMLGETKRHNSSPKTLYLVEEDLPSGH